MVGQVGPGLRPLRPTPHGPPTGSGGRRSGSLTEEKSGKRNGFSSFSQRVPVHVPSPPSRWAGRYGPFNVRAAGQVSSEKYSLPTPPHQREGGSRGGTSSPGGSFPHFFPRNGAPAGQAKVPCRSNGVGKNPQRPPPGRANSPTRSNSAGNSPFPPPPGYGILR